MSLPGWSARDLADMPRQFRARFRPCPHCLRNFDNRNRRRHTLACPRQQRERRDKGCYYPGGKRPS